jgi:hypothetical protein
MKTDRHFPFVPNLEHRAPFGASVCVCVYVCIYIYIYIYILSVQIYSFSTHYITEIQTLFYLVGPILFL